MSRNRLIVIIFDIIIPVAAGVAFWFVNHETPTAILITLAVVILSIAVQILEIVQRKNPRPQSAVANSLIENINTLFEHKTDSLFRSLLENKISEINSTEVGSKSFYETGGGAIEKNGIELIDGIKTGAFLTFLADLQDEWNVTENYFKKIRQAVKEREVKITRVFICDDENHLKDLSLLAFISEDDRSGIDTRIVLTRHVRLEDRGCLQDFGIWDEKILCLVTREGPRRDVVTCKYTADSEELQKAVRWKERLMSYAKRPREIFDKMTDTQVELLESACRMEEWSKDCTSFALGTVECSWYHSAWQYLRLLNLVASPDWHERFYSTKLLEVFQQFDNPKILICGSADYGMLSHVEKTAKAACRGSAEIIVIDLCRTPLKSCEWYASTHHIKIDTEQHDVLHFTPKNGLFDCIITDEFLTIISKSQRQKTVDKWKKLLNPGGFVITTAIQTEDAPCDNTTQAQREDYTNKCREQAIAKPSLIWTKIVNNEIIKIAEDYASRMVNCYFQDEGEIKKLFDEFDILEITTEETPGEFFHPTNSFEIFARKKNQ